MLREWTGKEKEYFRGTDEWINFSKNLREKRCNKCERCGIVGNLHTHHLFSSDYDNLNEKFFLVLCEDCHKIAHGNHVDLDPLYRDKVEYEFKKEILSLIRYYNTSKYTVSLAVNLQKIFDDEVSYNKILNKMKSGHIHRKNMKDLIKMYADDPEFFIQEGKKIDIDDISKEDLFGV